MDAFMTITGRNLKIYLRDKSAIFFSLLSMVIVIGLMVFFLGDMNVEAITQMLETMPDRDKAADKEKAELLILAWTCAGILSINGVTVSMAAYSVMIKDRVSGKLNSIYTAPVSRLTITAGYMAAAWIASIIICALTLALTELYCMTAGMEPFDFMTHVKLMGMIVVNSFTYAALMYLIAMLAKTEGAWSSMGTIIGTLVGFLGGIYIPIGALSETIGSIMKCTPIIYGAAMFRDTMTEDILQDTLGDLPAQWIEEYRLAMGIDLTVFSHKIHMAQELLLLMISGMICLVIGVCILKYGKKKDR
ncbi:MAG: ABC transporter permease [Firmicutes bacterium]|nr:ABC transporter permease [Bacillota bacterium]